MEKLFRKGTIIAIIIVSLSSGFLFATALAKNNPLSSNPATHQYFDKIAEMNNTTTDGPTTVDHFWQYGGDCDDRALALKDYLVNKGAVNVQICWVCYTENGTMKPSPTSGYLGHSFVVWNNKVYSPSRRMDHRFFNVDIESFQRFLKSEYGFNTWFFENQTYGTPF